jgi:Holliday junction resolvase
MRESILQKKIIKKLEQAGWLVVKIIQSTKNGWPDLQCHRGGETIFIECKSKTKKPTRLQMYRHNQLRRHGFIVFVIDSFENLPVI